MAFCMNGMKRILTSGGLAVAIAFSAYASDEEADRWEPSDGAEISFEVLRKGKPFGDHILKFSNNEDGDLVVTTDVDLKAGLGPITVFQYALDAEEVWRDGKLVGLKGQLNDDGDKGSVSAKLKGDVLQVDGTEYSGEAPGDIIPSSHWNIEQMRVDQILSTEDGELLDIKVEEIGREDVKVGDETVSATHYLMKSEIDVDLWYDDQGRWVKLAFEARGQEIVYKLRSLY